MQERYQRNDWSPEEQQRLGECHACVVGLGGLGGHVAELLARAGVGRITLVDGDLFEPSNMNRQRFATEESMGRGKAESTARELLHVNPEVRPCPVTERLTEENSGILKECQVVVDALDNALDRKMLQRVCRQLDIPLVHGAVSGWLGQVTTVFPGDDTMDLIYPGTGYAGHSSGNKSTPFAPAVIAAMESAEAVKVLLNRPGILRRRLLTLDLLTMESRIYQL